MSKQDGVERRWMLDHKLGAGCLVSGPDTEGFEEVMPISDHLERVEGLEAQLAEARDAHEATGTLVRRNVERYEKHKARADALQALLSEAIAKFERRASLTSYRAAYGAFNQAAQYLQQRLDELGTEGVPVRGGADG